jgi:hypothetical protein
VSGYTDYWERTASFTTRRELPGLQAVLIVNLGAAITIVSGDLQTLRLGPGEGFLTGIHDHHALSCSTGSQAGVHVWLTQRGFQTLAGSAVAAIANCAVTLRDLFGAAGAVLDRSCSTRRIVRRDSPSSMTRCCHGLSKGRRPGPRSPGRGPGSGRTQPAASPCWRRNWAGAARISPRNSGPAAA